jgi:hypothetical protein
LQFELYGVVTGYPPNIPIMDALARFLGIGWELGGWFPAVEPGVKLHALANATKSPNW